MSRYIAAGCVLALAASLGLPAIAKDQLSKDEEAKVDAMEVFTGAPDRSFDAIGPVTGQVCVRNRFATSDKGRFKHATELKLQAVRLGADAIIDTKCSKTGGTSFFKNCWDSLQCAGTAIKYR